jgi:FtsZ-binding cell division protein ZapB
MEKGIKHGAKGAKHSKETSTLVGHIENVAQKREALKKAQHGHDEHLRGLYEKHGSTMDVPVNVRSY